MNAQGGSRPVGCWKLAGKLAGLMRGRLNPSGVGSCGSQRAAISRSLISSASVSSVDENALIVAGTIRNISGSSPRTIPSALWMALHTLDK